MKYLKQIVVGIIGIVFVYLGDTPECTSILQIIGALMVIGSIIWALSKEFKK